MFATDPTRDALREQLSALMDGELSREESLFLLKRMEHDAELCAEWERLHVASALQQGEYQRVSSGFCGRVMAAVAVETQVAAEGQRTRVRTRVAMLPRWLGTVAGGAVAAAVAYVALVHLGPQRTVPQPATLRPLATAAAPTAVRPGSAATGTMNLPSQLFAPAAQTSGGTALAGPATANLKLDRYLLRHSEALGRPATGVPQLLSPAVFPVRFGDSAGGAQSAAR